MQKFLKPLSKGVLLFVLWAVIGACLYSIGATVVLRPSAFGLPAFAGLTPEPEPIALPAIDERIIEGSAVHFAMTQRPADLDFDAEGAGYVLDETGLLFRVDAEGVRDTVPHLILRNEKTEAAVPFKALALHPGYLDPGSRGHGLLYVIEPERPGTKAPDYTPEFGEGEHHQDVLCEYKTLDPTARVFTGARRELLRLSQPGPDHNMNDLAFDRLGRLFIATGDGARAKPGPEAPSRNAMSLLNPYGKILRIDPLGEDSSNGQYGLPGRNPFAVIDGALEEIWCYGLRDPRRIEFDPFRDWLSIIDVGQGDIEEVNISEFGGEHFGWDLCEGSYFYPPAGGDRPTEGVVGPRAEFAKAAERQITGGFVYRGESFPSLRGKLVFADSSGRLMASRIDGRGVMERLLVGNQVALNDETIAGVRSGRMGELFILTGGGNIYELQKRITAEEKPRRKKSRPLMAWTL